MSLAEKQPQVSVIVPAYNAANYIRESLVSALRQTYANLEILVSDDGSADGTCRIVEELCREDGRVRLLPGTHAGLPGVVRNRAMREASGDYIAFLDADDLWAPSKIEEQLAAIGSRTDFGLCYTAAREFRNRNEIPSDLAASPLDKATQGWASHVLQGLAGYEAILARRVAVCTPSVLIPRSLLDRTGYFSESASLRCAEDVDFLARAYSAGEAVFAPQVLVYIRKHERNTSRERLWPALFEMVRLAQERGHLPPSLAGRVWSAAWITRAEEMLSRGERGWRGSMAKAWMLEPGRLARWVALGVSGLPERGAKTIYFGLRG